MGRPKKRVAATATGKNGSTGASSDALASTPPGEAPVAAPKKTPASWVKGQSGNPAGRLKGVKLKITEYKAELESAFRGYIANDVRRTRLFNTWDRMLSIVENGEDKDAIAAYRAFSLQVLSQLKPEEPTGEAGGGKIILEIHNHTGGDEPAVGVVIEDVIDGEYEDVTHGT